MEDINSIWEEIKYEVGELQTSNGKGSEILIGSGDKNAPILFVGDDMTLYQDENLKVESGSSGEFLIKLCDWEHISPQNYYITTLAKKDCKFNDYFGASKEKLRELLLVQIALIRPKIIVGLGGKVGEVLLGHFVDVHKKRQEIIPYSGDIKLIFTYDVSAVRQSRLEQGRNSEMAKNFWKDIQLIKKELEKCYG